MRAVFALMLSSLIILAMLPSGAAASEWSHDDTPRCQVLVTTADAHDIAFGDLDGDGLVDIALASTHGIEIFKQADDGTYEDASTLISVPHTLVDLECADVNHDSVDDLVVLFSDDTVRWAIQSESFDWNNESHIISITTPGTKVGIVVADLDDDGAMDVVVGITYSDQARIWTCSNITGTIWGHTESVPDLDGVSALELANIDDNESQDLIVAGASENVAVMLNGGQGGMGPVDWSHAGTIIVYGPTSVSRVRWNASDARDHISLVGHNGPTQDERLLIFHLDDTLILTTSTGYLDDDAWPCAILNDGSGPTAYLCTPSGVTMRCPSEEGRLGTCTPSFPCHDDVILTTSHDTDGDGNDELFIISSETCTVMWGSEPSNADSVVMGLPSWDMISMGYLESSVAIVTAYGTQVVISDCDGQTVGSITTEYDIIDIGLHDFDGHGEIVCLDTNGTVSSASGAGIWDQVVHSGVSNATVLGFGDVNGDGTDDVIVGGSGVAWVDVNRTTGPGGGVSMSGKHVTSLASGDLNSASDPMGWLDIAVVENGTLTFLVRDDGAFDWEFVPIVDLPSPAVKVLVSDVDGDCLEDAVALLEDGSLMTFRQLETDYFGVGSHRTLYTPTWGYEDIFTGDTDDDGVDEIIGVNSTAGTGEVVSLLSGTVVSRMFAGDGSLTAFVLDVDGDGRSDTAIGANVSSCVSVDLGINHAPHASISTPSQVMECHPVLLSATGTTDDLPDMATLNYTWSIMGDEYHGSEVGMTFPDAGPMNVTLTVRDVGGLSSSVTIVLMVDDVAPEADAEVSATMIEGTSYPFVDASTMAGDVVAWTWDFGDGGTSSSQDPDHTYQEDGAYSLTLNVTDDEGNWDEAIWSVTVEDAGLQASMDVGGDRVEGSTLLFNDTSDSLPDAIAIVHWDMGDGTTLNGSTVEHVYESNGTYVVRLTVVDDDGRTAWSNATLAIGDVVPTVAIVGVTEGLSDGDVLDLYADVATWDPLVSIEWTVDGEVVSSDPSLEWGLPDDGTYVVNVTVVDSDGSRAEASVTIGVADKGLVADFTAPLVIEGEATTIEDGSDSWPDAIVSWEWTVEDVIVVTEDLVWTFNDSGGHLISLRVMDDDGRTAWCDRTVQVEDSVPDASISCDSTSVAEGDVLTLMDDSTSHDPVASRTWEVDGSTYGHGTTVDVTFVVEGEHIVKLTLVDSDGSASSASVVIDVHDLSAIASFDTQGMVVEGEPVVFIDRSDSWPDELVNWTWDMGDGTVAHGQGPIHTYAQDGTYLVNLTVTDSDDRVFWTSSAIIVADTGPKASFTSSPPSSLEFSEVVFEDASSSHDPVSLITWTVDGMAVSNGTMMTHAFEDNGTHIVRLTVTDVDGDSDTYTTQYVVVDTSPSISTIASSSGDGLEEGEWTTVSVTVDAADPVLRYVWDTGDGVCETLTPSIEHSWSRAGEYVVSVEAWDKDSSTTMTITLVVSNVPPVASFDVSSREGGLVLVDASETSDTQGDALTYWWNFGDGNGFAGPLTSPTTSYQYGSGGSYEVTLRAMDDDGRVDEMSVDVYVDMSPPVLSRLRIVSGGVGSIPTTIAVTVGDDGTVMGVTLGYRVNGTVEEVTMTPNGEGDWEAQIPRFDTGTEISYWVTATDGSGNAASTGDVGLRIVDAAEDVPAWAWFALVVALAALAAIVIMLMTPRVEEVFIIYSDGRLIAHESRRVRPMDQDIMSSMLIAIQDFVRESFRDEGDTTLEGMRFGDNEIIVSRGEHIYVAAVGAKGRVSGVRDAVARLVEDLETDFEVGSWDGDMESFRGMRDRATPLFRRVPRVRRSYNR